MQLYGLVGGRVEIFTIPKGRSLLGRDPSCQHRIRNPYISRKHASFNLTSQSLLLSDLGSTGGTWVNETKIEEETPVSVVKGDVLRFSQATFIISNDFDDQIEETFRNEKKLPQLMEDDSPTFLRPDTLERIKSSLSNGDYNDIEELFAFAMFAKKRMAEQHVLHELSLMFTGILDLRDLLEAALRLTASYFEADRGFVLIFNDDLRKFEELVTYHFEQNELEKEKQDSSFSQTIARQCQREGKILLTEDILGNLDIVTSQSVIRTNPLSICCIPLCFNGSIHGVLYLDSNHRPNLFSKAQNHFMSVLSTQLAVNLENARLFAEAVTDGLTKILNRRYLNKRANEEFEASKRYGYDISAIMLDLDHFKALNDQYGHAFGDKVLVETAKVLSKTSRRTDIVGRYGGEEFLLILPHTTQKKAEILAERLRQSLENMELNFGEKTISVTASLGLMSFKPGERDTFNTLSLGADMALFKSKENGRNRVSTINREELIVQSEILTGKPDPAYSH